MTDLVQRAVCTRAIEDPGHDVVLASASFGERIQRATLLGSLSSRPLRLLGSASDSMRASSDLGMAIRMAERGRGVVAGSPGGGQSNVDCGLISSKGSGRNSVCQSPSS